MALIQRSGDMLTASGPGGINETQYAAFQMMIAQVTGYKPGKFTHFIANEQIYDRHMDAANEILRRYTMDVNTIQPQLIIAPKTDFYDFTIGDFTLVNYVPQKPQLTLELGI